MRLPLANPHGLNIDPPVLPVFVAKVFEHWLRPVLCEPSVYSGTASAVVNRPHHLPIVQNDFIFRTGMSITHAQIS